MRENAKSFNMQGVLMGGACQIALCLFSLTGRVKLSISFRNRFLSARQKTEQIVCVLGRDIRGKTISNEMIKDARG